MVDLNKINMWKSKEKIKPLIKVLNKDNSKEVLIAAINALSTIGDDRAVPALIKTMSIPDLYDVRAAAKDAVLQIVNQEIGTLVTMLAHNDENMRASAVSVIGEIGNKNAIEPLIKALNDSFYKVSWYSAKALGKIGDQSAVEPLINALEYEHDFVQREAACALGCIGDKRAVEPLIIRAMVFEDYSIYCEIAEALGKLGDKRAVPALIHIVKDSGLDKYACDEAIKVLGRFGDARAIEPLIDALGYLDYDLRSHASEALVQTGADAVEPLIEMLKNRGYVDDKEDSECSWNRVQLTISTLGEIGDVRAVDQLRYMVEHNSDEDFRSLAQEALKKIENK